jgi:hypothetical protein
VLNKDQKTDIGLAVPAVPEQVSVALAELAGEVQEGLWALAVGIGLQVMAAMMEADVTAACGPQGRHDPERTATRHGYGAGSVSLGGWRVPVSRPRMRVTDGFGGTAGASCELFSQTEVLGRRVLERMLAGGIVAALPGRAGTGEHAHRAGRLSHVEVGRLAPVRRRDRDRGGPTAAADLSTLDLVGGDDRRGALR